MLPKTFFALLFCTFIALTSNTHAKETESEDFCYDDDEDCGPSHWSGACEENAVHQSPIDIVLNPSVVDQQQMLVAFHNYSTEQFGFSIVNNGHSIQLKSLSVNAVRPKIFYEAWGEYIFEQAHFHWGENSSVGSEHTLNGSSTPMEIHLVHYSSRFANFDAALESDDPSALSVVGVLVELSIFPNPELDCLVQSLEHVADASQLGVPANVTTSFKLDYFLPTVRDFFSYDGSLTTPPCYEEVKWTFLNHPITVSASQLEPFRLLASNHVGGLLTKNYRPIQPLGDRKIEFYRAIEPLNGAQFFSLSFSLVLLVVSSTALQIFS